MSCQGIDLDGGAFLAAAIPYPEDNHVIVASKRGMVAYVTFERAQAHHKGSQGSALFSIGDGDGVVSTIKSAELLFFACSNGRVLCIKSNCMTAQNRGGKGRIAMKTGNGEIIAVLPLHGELF